MSKYVDDMQVGQPLLLKGPKGRFKYEPGLYRAVGESRAPAAAPGEP